MRKHLVSLCIGVIIGGATFGAAGAFASTPKASGYCTKAEVGKTGSYTTASTHVKKTVKCTKVPTYKYTWKLVTK